MQPSEAPYVGPAPFDTGDRKRFFGRERETGELTSLVLSHPITLLVASSGAGKTSLVNAGLIPRLTGIDDNIRRCEVLPVVLFRQGAAQGNGNGGIVNRFLSYALHALGSNGEGLPPGSPGSLVAAVKERELVTDRFGQPLPRVLIVDQFEELFTLHPQFWEDRRSFLDELLTLVDTDPMTRILLAMREEYLARLEQLGGMRAADNLRYRLHLERLDRDNALKAVTGPLPDEVTFAAGVAESLVDELRRESSAGATNDAAPESFLGRYVEPVHLQVVCQTLWNALPPGTTEITEELRLQHGSVDRALEAFYAGVVSEAADADPAVPEGLIRHWIENDLISGRVSRNTVPLDEAEAAGIPGAVLDRLVDRHLIRREDRFNFPWYELTHDRLIAPIISNNAHWFADNPDPLYAVQQQTRQWLREEQQTGYLLTGEPLVEASALARDHPELLSREERDFVRASEELQRDYDEREQSRRRSRLIALGSAIAAGAMLLLALFAFRLQQEADDQRAEAERQQQISLSQTIASQAMLAHSQSQDDLGALLARQAYLFDEDNAVLGDTGTALQATIGSPSFSRTIETPHAWISSLAFDPLDGAILATAGGANSDSMVYLWHGEGTSWTESHRLADPETERSHHSGATGVSFAPDGSMVFTSGGDGFAKVWNAESGELVERLEGPGGAIRGIDAGPSVDGVMLLAAASCRSSADQTLDLAASAPACGSRAAVVRVWEIVTGSAGEPRDLEAGMERLDSLAISPDGQWLAAGGCASFVENSSDCAEGDVLVWSLTEPEAEPTSLGPFAGSIFALEFVAREGVRLELAIAGEDRSVRIAEFDDAGIADAEPRLLAGHRDVVQSLAYSPTLHMLAAGDHDATVGVWRLDQPDPVIGVLGNATDWIRSLAFDPSGSLLASTTGGGQIRLWNLGPRSDPPAALSGHNDYVRALAFLQQEGPALLASAGEDGRVRLWDFSQSAVTETVIPMRDDGLAFKLSSIDWDQAGRRILTGAEDGVARISTLQDDGSWSTTPLNAIPFRSGAVYAVFAPDDSLVITADASGAVRLWSTDGGPPRGDSLPGDPMAAINALVLTADGTLLAAADRSGQIRIWELGEGGRTAALLHTVEQGAEVRALAFGPDNLLAAGGAPGELDITLQIWNARSGEFVTSLPVKQGEVRSLAFSPNGSQLASGGKDQTVLLWNPESWEATPVTIQVPEWIRALAYAPDGSMIAVPTTQGGIRTIDPDIESLSNAVCESVSENLSLSQWTSFVGQDARLPYAKTCEDLGVPDGIDPTEIA
ncbi:MAG: WD40 repeat domain-containing protein [Thermomicrobiales bacterium]